MEPVNFLKPESEIRNEVIYDTGYINETIDTTKGAEPFEIIDSMTSEGYGRKAKNNFFTVFKEFLSMIQNFPNFLLFMIIFKL